MKKILAAFAVALSTACAFAQDQALDLQPGYAQQQILTVPYSVSNFDYDASGNLCFSGGDSSDYYQQNEIIEATAASDFATLTPVVEFSSPTYGSFVTVQSGTVYYGDSSNVYATSLSATPPSSPTVLTASLPSNYDMEFSGTTGFVSANSNGYSNQVFAIDPGTGDATPVMDTGGDYSGPIALTSAGGLIYGATGAADIYGIYSFTAAQVQQAITSGTELELTQGTLLASNSGNSAFAIGPDNELIQAYSPYTGPEASITEYNLVTGSSTLIGTVDSTDYSIVGVRDQNGAITVAETDGGSFTDFITVSQVPEPSAPLAITLGLGGLLPAAAAIRRRARTN